MPVGQQRKHAMEALLVAQREWWANDPRGSTPSPQLTVGELCTRTLEQLAALHGIRTARATALAATMEQRGWPLPTTLEQVRPTPELRLAGTLPAGAATRPAVLELCRSIASTTGKQWSDVTIDDARRWSQSQGRSTAIVEALHRAAAAMRFSGSSERARYDATMALLARSTVLGVAATPAAPKGDGLGATTTPKGRSLRRATRSGAVTAGTAAHSSNDGARPTDRHLATSAMERLSLSLLPRGAATASLAVGDIALRSRTELVALLNGDARSVDAIEATLDAKGRRLRHDDEPAPVDGRARLYSALIVAPVAAPSDDDAREQLAHSQAFATKVCVAIAKLCDCTWDRVDVADLRRLTSTETGLAAIELAAASALQRVAPDRRRAFLERIQVVRDRCQVPRVPSATTPQRPFRSSLRLD